MQKVLHGAYRLRRAFSPTHEAIEHKGKEKGDQGTFHHALDIVIKVRSRQVCRKERACRHGRAAVPKVDSRQDGPANERLGGPQG